MTYKRQMQLKELERLIPIARRTFHKRKKYVKIERKLDMLDKRSMKLKKQREDIIKARDIFEEQKINIDESPINFTINEFEEKIERLEEEMESLRKMLEITDEEITAEEDYFNTVFGFFKLKLKLTRQEIPERDVYIILYMLWLWGYSTEIVELFFENYFEFYQMFPVKHINCSLVGPNNLKEFFASDFEDIFCKKCNK